MNLEFTPEESQYYNYKLERSKGAGVLSSVSSLFSGIKSTVWGSSTSGEDFVKHASKSIGEKTLLVNFSKNNLSKDIESLDIQTPNPMILYVHDMNNALAKRVLKDIIQNKEIACFINANFHSSGVI